MHKKMKHRLMYEIDEANLSLLHWLCVFSRFLPICFKIIWFIGNIKVRSFQHELEFLKVIWSTNNISVTLCISNTNKAHLV